MELELTKVIVNGVELVPSAPYMVDLDFIILEDGIPVNELNVDITTYTEGEKAIALRKAGITWDTE